ncbi:MAG: hypothetical protein V1745_03355 [Patescibacteria group bacterium]
MTETLFSRKERRMADDPIIRIGEAADIQALLDAPEWTYIGSTICEPIRDEIRLTGAKHGLPAWVVYDLLNLDIPTLCLVYRLDDFFSGAFQKRRFRPPPQNEADSGYYHVLRFQSCYWHDFESWSDLAALTGRSIVFHRDIPFPGTPARRPIAIFHPDGHIEERIAFVEHLRTWGVYDAYASYKRHILASKCGA